MAETEDRKQFMNEQKKQVLKSIPANSLILYISGMRIISGIIKTNILSFLLTTSQVMISIMWHKAPLGNCPACPLAY